MPYIEAIQASLRAQLDTIIAVAIIILVLWLVRRQAARLLLWLLSRNLDESKKYIIKVIDQSVHDFIDRALLAAFVYAITLFFAQNPRLAATVNNIAHTIFLFTAFRLIYDLARAITASSHRLRDLTGLKVDRMLMPLIRLVADGLIYVSALITIAQTWEVQLTTLVAGL
ncbi:MAG: hypothetical protein AAF125_27060, partial [Chloroflexota bacterium]